MDLVVISQNSTEWINRKIGRLLRTFGPDKHICCLFLLMVEYSLNNVVHESTGFCQYFIHLRKLEQIIWTMLLPQATGEDLAVSSSKIKVM